MKIGYFVDHFDQHMRQAIAGIINDTCDFKNEKAIHFQVRLSSHGIHLFFCQKNTKPVYNISIV